MVHCASVRRRAVFARLHPRTGHHLQVGHLVHLKQVILDSVLNGLFVDILLQQFRFKFLVERAFIIAQRRLDQIYRDRETPYGWLPRLGTAASIPNGRGRGYW